MSRYETKVTNRCCVRSKVINSELVGFASLRVSQNECHCILQGPMGYFLMTEIVFLLL